MIVKPDLHNFAGAFDFVLERLRDDKPFALVRFGDGELGILRGEKTGNAEFQYDGDEEFQDQLWEAFRYQHPDYYVGIGCPCCVGQADFEWMRDESMQDEDHLTYNNVLVNANYARIQEFCDAWEIKPYDSVPLLIGRPGCPVVKMPMPMVRHEIMWNAWRYIEGIVDEIVYDKDKFLDSGNHIILCAAGPASEVIIHQLFQRYPNNKYIDVGSIFDPWLFGKETRGYHSPEYPTARKICRWG